MTKLKSLIPPIVHLNVHSTCMLKCEFCAKSQSNFSKYPAMPLEKFKKYVDMYTDYGTTIFELTPPVGDAINLKPEVLREYLDYLEQNDKVEGYFFYTSLVTSKRMSSGEYDFIFDRKKFLMQLSLYAVNKDEFIKRTSGQKKQYDILLDNIYYILKNIDKLQLCVSDRTTYGNALGLYMKNNQNLPTTEPSPAFRSIINIIKASPRICLSTSDEILPDHNYKKTTDKTTVNKNTGICLDMLMATGPFPDGKVSLCSWIDSRKEMIKGNLDEITPEELYKDYFIGEDGEERINTNSLGFDKKHFVCSGCDYYDDGTVEGGRASEGTIRRESLDIGKTLEDKVNYIRRTFIEMLESLRASKGWNKPTWW